jgi:peptidoglycan/LPS O-acetylase OafA/YrhL
LPQLSQSDEPTLRSLLYISPLARLFEFVTGLVTCSAFRLLQPLGKRLSRSTFTALEIAVVVIIGYSVANNLVFWTFAGFFPAAGPAPLEWLAHAAEVVILPFVVLVFAFGAGLLSERLTGRPMLALGEMSYSTYLLHSGGSIICIFIS